MTSPPSLRRSQARPASAERRGGHRRPPTRRRQWGRGFRVLSLLPLLAFLVAFTAYPLFQLARMSVSEVSIRGGEFVWGYTGVANYEAAASDDIARYSFWITGLFIAVTVPATVILGTLLAILVHRSVLLAGVARNVLLWPALIAPVVVSVIW